jgi:hypothetical protein
LTKFTILRPLNSKTAEEVGHHFYVRCPIHTAERQWPRICEQNNTKLG